MSNNSIDTIYIELARKWLSGTITAEEKQLFADWYNNQEEKEVLIPASFVPDEESHRLRILQKIEAVIVQDKIFQASVTPDRNTPRRVQVHRVHFLKTSWFRYAAAVILLVGGAAVYWLLSRFSEQSPLPPFTRGSVADVQPGGNKAILTVGNKQINLSSDKTGIAVGSTVTYADGSTILNQVQNDAIPLVKGGRGDWLQLATPRGGQYQAILPDGSKVWLNAASSIRFPSKFTGSTREVEINGEAYLEIAKNAQQPFLVHAPKTTVQVLGTSFNVNAYEDEEVERTTLIEGSVRVNNKIIQPGQQAQLTNNRLSIEDCQVEAAIAWKNGVFQFNRMPLADAMRQISRWYNVEVIYEKGIPDIKFWGKIKRDLSLPQLLDALGEVGVKFKFKGRTLIVTAS